MSGSFPQIVQSRAQEMLIKSPEKSVSKQHISGFFSCTIVLDNMLIYRR